MVDIDVSYEGDLHCTAKHGPSGATLATDAPVDNQGKGEFFSRGLQSPLTGTTNWTTEETPFLLKKGEKPDLVKLNLVINGKGTAWIDDVLLLKGPLP